MGSEAPTLFIVEPPSSAVAGNAVTAGRWAGMATALGWKAIRAEGWDGRACDAMLALHARKSHDSILRFRRAHPDAPLIVAGTGTDLYTDVPDSGEVAESLGVATRVVVLQPLAIDVLPASVHERARVIYQSVAPPYPPREPDPETFQVCQLANLRPVKDPLLVALATHDLPADARTSVAHLGGVIDPDLGLRAEQEAASNPRYRWLGERPRDEALATLADSRLLVCASRHEGGANAVSEALALGVPVLASRIPGNLGLLGETYPGTFPVGDAGALGELLRRAETDADFLAELERACAAQAWIVDPSLELESWRRLLGELAP